MSARILLVLLLMVSPAFAQGFAGMGGDATGFTLPQRGHVPVFPRDHAAHPDFRIEWWYVTANLKAADGTEYGAQWTLFRAALAPGEGTGWDSPQMWMADAALTTPQHHYFAERLARGGIGQAGVTQAPFAASLDDWQMRSRAEGDADPLSAIDITAEDKGFSYRLALDATGPLVLHGERGFSQKSERGQASYYYSQPFYHVTGSISVEGREIPVTGKAWFDHEWSSQPLDATQSGWDWFALHFDGGDKLMANQFRDQGKGYIAATWISRDGHSETLAPSSVQLTALEWGDAGGHRVPLRWRVVVPSKGIDVTTRPINPNAWMATLIPYWEGPVRVEGSAGGSGYMELTGYK